MTRKVWSVFAALIFLVASLAGCSGGGGGTPAPKSTPALTKAIESGRKTVVFFMNPQGGPCVSQDRILRKLHADTGGKFNIAYVKTTVPEDKQAFYDYGVRSLPSLVFLNEKGEIAHYFPPGIQPYEVLSDLIAKTE